MSKSGKVSTYCYQCVNGPDMLAVEVTDGVATTVTPNFDAKGYHPADGKVCVKPYGLVQKIYNPNRILTPLKRTNPKKGRDQDPGWVEIGWGEALDAVAAKLNAIRETNLLDEQGYPRLAFTTGGAATPYFYMGTFVCFLAAWGPVDQSLGAGGTVKCYHTEHVYGELWHRAFTVCPDTPRCEYIVSFGNNIDASGGVTSVRRHADARARHPAGADRAAPVGNRRLGQRVDTDPAEDRLVVPLCNAQRAFARADAERVGRALPQGTHGLAVPDRT